MAKDYVVHKKNIKYSRVKRRRVHTALLMSMAAIIRVTPSLAQNGSSFSVTVTGDQSCTFQGSSFSTTVINTITHELKDRQDFGDLSVTKQLDACDSLLYAWAAGGLPLVSVVISAHASVNGADRELERISFFRPILVSILATNENSVIVESLKFTYDSVETLDSLTGSLTTLQKTGTGIKTSSLVITTTTLGAGILGQAYSQILSANGGKGTYSWTVLTGRLPPGLALNALTGEISGIPTASTSGSTMTFQVTDASSPPQSATVSLTLTIKTDKEAGAK